MQYERCRIPAWRLIANDQPQDNRARIHAAYRAIQAEPHGGNPDEGGDALLRHADLVADTIEAAQNEVCSAANDSGTHIQLVCSEAIALYWIAPRLAQFQLSNPDTIVDLTISDSPSDFHDLAGDIAIQGLQPTESDLMVSRIGRSHYAGFVSAEWEKDHAMPSSLSDLARRKALVHSPYSELLQISETASRVST